MTVVDAASPTCNVGSFMERDIDVWLAEELRVSEAFAGWFAERSGMPSDISCPASRVRVSVMGENGETDVEAIFMTSTGHRHALLVENKLEHSLKIEQLNRYKKRGQYGISYGHWDTYTVSVFAPAVKLIKYASEIDTTAKISFEEAADHVRKATNDFRSMYRAEFLLRAASEQRADVATNDAFRILFWKRIYHLLEERYPGYFAINPNNFPKTTFIAANCVGSPSYLRLDLKGTKGEVDISFKTQHPGRLVKFLEEQKPPVTKIVFNKESIALQIVGLPAFFVGDGIELAEGKAMESYAAAHLLIEFWREHRIFFDNLYKQKAI